MSQHVVTVLFYDRVNAQRFIQALGDLPVEVGPVLPCERPQDGRDWKVQVTVSGSSSSVLYLRPHALVEVTDRAMRFRGRPEYGVPATVAP